MKGKKFEPYFPTCDNCCFEQKKATRATETIDGYYFSCYSCLVSLFGIKEASRQWNQMSKIEAKCGWCDLTKDNCKCGKERR